ncbi:MAG: hypothetical protein IT164_19955 [Bryobacterales bacterium]|nr:hypothetical protein [Bryobacterales bacterium]
MLVAMDAPPPYLSLVVTARNDDHGEDFLKRMQAFTDGWIEQSNRFRFPSELIIVEWNPMPERAPLAEALSWPEGNQYCTVRIITVPGEAHQRYRHAPVLGLYQMIAKNVGIRRARGSFVLATNIDILFSSELMERLAQRDLCGDRMYRMDRMDARSEIPENAGVEERLAWCARNLLRVNTRNGSFPVTPDGVPVPGENDVVKPGAGISLAMDWYSPEFYAGMPYRWLPDRATLLLEAPNGPEAGELSIELEPGLGTGYGPFLLCVAREDGAPLAERHVSARTTVTVPTGLPPAGQGRLTLYVVGGGLRTKQDPRLTNVQVRSIVWGGTKPLQAVTPRRRLRWWLSRLHRRWAGIEKAPPTVHDREELGVQSGLAYEGAWSDWERLGPGLARWPGAGAGLALTATGGARELELDVEPGPGAVGRTLRLVLSGADGGTLASAAIPGRMRLRWQAGSPAAGKFTVGIRGEVDGDGTGGDRSLTLHGAEWRAARPSSTSGHVLEPVNEGGLPVHLHTNGCGDFTLLSREAWFNLRGYPEFDAFSMNIDSVLCWAAHHAGYREEMLDDPMRTYHIEHGRASGWTPEGEAALYERIARKRIPLLDYETVINWARDMNRFGMPILFNHDNWGLASDQFAERVIR